jgi:hypothetical protein
MNDLDEIKKIIFHYELSNMGFFMLGLSFISSYLTTKYMIHKTNKKLKNYFNLLDKMTEG